MRPPARTVRGGAGGSAARVFRSNASLRWAIACGVLSIFFAVLGALSGGPHVFGFALAALLLVTTWRAWEWGIHLEADRVTIHGFLRADRFGSDEVDHFAVLPLGPYPYAAHVVLQDGRTFGSYAICAGSPRSKADRVRQPVQDQVDALNYALSEQRGRASAG